MTSPVIDANLSRTEWPVVIEQALLARGINEPRYVEVVTRLFDAVLSGARSVGVSGSQGSGKSTLSKVLQTLSEPLLGLRAVVLSLDDFYLTRSERADLARVHPLLRTRGVPGTHDADGLARAIDQLLSGEVIEVPVFDKGEDDRRPALEIVGPCDFVLVEGWCLGARPEPPGRLQEPVNSLERVEDADQAWRRSVNTALEQEAYRRLSRFDYLLYLQPALFDHVLRWRQDQEERFNQGAMQMDRAALHRFIAHYERVTRWMMEDLPDRANLTVTLDRDHHIQRMVLS